MKVAIVGIRGYTGIELARLLSHHPAVEHIIGFSTGFDGKTIDDVSAGLEAYSLMPLAPSNISILPLSEWGQAISQIDFVFLATPAETSLELVPKILAANKKVIDLSGAFRLDEAEFERFYQLTRSESGSVSFNSAQYGLVPWNKKISKDVLFVSNPGCYATAILMALLPLLSAGLIDAKTLVIDAKSGATGAGKKPQENLLLSELAEECLPYKVGQHQHLPEIQKYCVQFANKTIDPHFTTHILPLRRGISAGIYAHISDEALKLAGQNTGESAGKVGIDKTSQVKEMIQSAFTTAYSNYPLLRFSQSPQKALLSLKKVTGTSHTHICYELIGTKLYLFSTIDNLLKGAASQAIENFNLMSGYPVTAGLLPSFNPSDTPSVSPSFDPSVSSGITTKKEGTL